MVDMRNTTYQQAEATNRLTEVTKEGRNATYEFRERKVDKKYVRVEAKNVWVWPRNTQDLAKNAVVEEKYVAVELT